MWITVTKQMKTVYPHVDRLCATTRKLFTVFTLQVLVQIKKMKPSMGFNPLIV